MARLEFETLDELKSHLHTSKNLTGAVFQSLDLTAVQQELDGALLADNVLLGCQTNASVLQLFQSPIVFPTLPNLPFDPFRSALYSPEELLGGYEIGKPETYETTVDGKSYQHYVDTGKADASDVVITLARRLHDHGISDALQEYLANHKVVAIMGGHSMKRSEPIYLEVARLSRDLVLAGYLPVTGGGPGAMEATNLGAWFAERDDAELADAVSILAQAPHYKPKDKWLDTAFTVVQKYPLTSAEKCQSVGIPTWLYGHEPPTCFAVNIAKYFANSVREEGLLAIATYGVIFAPGNAGTIQEVFQDAAQNHYKSFGIASPMIFLGRGYWKWDKPVFPLLTQLAAGKEYSSLIGISDSRLAILEQINSFAKSIDAN